MVNPDDELRRLDEALARLKAVADAEHHVHLEQMFSASQDHSWPPAPNTEHPSLADSAPSIRRTMQRDDCYQVNYVVRRRPRIMGFSDDLIEPPELPIRTLQVRKAWTNKVPFVGEPFVYVWKVAVDDTNRWVAGDSWVEHPRRSR